MGPQFSSCPLGMIRDAPGLMDIQIQDRIPLQDTCETQNAYRFGVPQKQARNAVIRPLAEMSWTIKNKFLAETWRLRHSGAGRKEMGDSESPARERAGLRIPHGSHAGGSIFSAKKQIKKPPEGGNAVQLRLNGIFSLGGCKQSEQLLTCVGHVRRHRPFPRQPPRSARLAQAGRAFAC